MELKIRNYCLALLCFMCCNMNALAQKITDFYFEEAQPRKEEALAHFPRTLRGLYKSTTDSTRRVRITADSIAFEIPMVQFASPQQLRDKNYTFTDSLVLTPDNRQLPAMLRNDTIYFVDFIQSVLFVKDASHIIKQADDVYVLSREVSKDKWDCMLLTRDGGGRLCIAYFDFSKNMQDIGSNKRIDEVKGDEKTYYLANLKKKDFSKLIEKNYFPDKQYFYKRFEWQ